MLTNAVGFMITANKMSIFTEMSRHRFICKLNVSGTQVLDTFSNYEQDRIKSNMD